MVGIYLSIAALLCFLIWPHWLKAYTLMHWRHQLNLQQHLPAFKQLYQHVDGFLLSRLARKHHDAMEYTYGEIEFTSFIALIAMTQPTPATRFYDLGSGTGKAVLACAMVFDLQHYSGIELFNELHHQALIQQQALQQLPAYNQRAKKIHFINTNFLNADLHQATLIFINATALFGPTWEQLNQKLSNEVLCNAVIITTSKPLLSTSFIVTNTTKVTMSWGVVMAYIHSSLH